MTSAASPWVKIVLLIRYSAIVLPPLALFRKVFTSKGAFGGLFGCMFKFPLFHSENIPIERYVASATGHAASVSRRRPPFRWQYRLRAPRTIMHLPVYGPSIPPRP